MAGKSKFQISRLLDEKIKSIVGDANEFEPEFSQLEKAYLIGFHCGNVTNFIGLSTDHKLKHVVLQVVGQVFFKSSPTEADIKDSLMAARVESESSESLGSFKEDKNDNLFLIYTVDQDSKETSKRIFDTVEGSFVEAQPKLSVLDESKIYNHSAMTKLCLNLRLDICDSSMKLKSPEKIVEVLNNVKSSFGRDTKNVKIHLRNSNFSINSPAGNKSPTENLYSYLDAPKDIDQMGDYLPQMTKKDKEKLVDKWRNKVKDQRAPLELELEIDELGFDKSESLPPGTYGLQMELYLHLQMNDSLTKSIQLILLLVRKQLNLLQESLATKTDKLIEQGELKHCTFRPSILGHLIYNLYAIPSSGTPDYQHLAEQRRELHLTYLIPLDRPQFRYVQRLLNVTSSNQDEQAGYLCNVHTGILESSGIKGGSRNVIAGNYTYHHYMQDRINDNGWGCAYRSLQTIISWFKHQGYIYTPDVELRAPKEAAAAASKAGEKIDTLRRKLHQESRVPTHEEIQSVLVDVGDKQPTFIGSQKWIGSQEVCYVLNHLYNIDSKFISVSSGSELASKARDLGAHFAAQFTPIMIGGGVLAHTIIGVDFNQKNGDISYLILDPHYTGAEDLSVITKKGWCGWKKNSFWDKNAFYNLCLPQKPNEF